MKSPDPTTRLRKLAQFLFLGIALIPVLISIPGKPVKAEPGPEDPLPLEAPLQTVGTCPTEDVLGEGVLSQDSPVVSLAAGAPTDGRLGTCYANYKIGDDYLAPWAYQAGSRWDRVDFSWRAIEPQPGAWSFTGHDDLVTRDTDSGLSVIGILMATPSWAANCQAATAEAESLPTTQSHLDTGPSIAAIVDPSNRCPPRNLYLAWDDPNNYWANYVRQTVRHFRGRVSVWEIWNEPDLGQEYWIGSVADYAQLLKVGYQAIKAEDPNATVLFAGLAYWANRTYYISVLDVLQAMGPEAEANHYYFDVMSLHLYSSVYKIRPVVEEIQGNMTARVGAHPIWLTETGVPIWDDHPNPSDAYKVNRATSHEAAAYVIEGFAEARAAGIEKFLFFRTHDNYMTMTDGQPEYFGLIRDDSTIRPAYVAYQLVATYLQGENQVTRPSASGNVQRITFWGTPRGRVDVLWNVGDTTVDYSYPASMPSATLITQQGAAWTLPAIDGAYHVTLGPATARYSDDGNFLIGGPPIIVVQGDTTPPTSQLHTLPSTWYGKTVELSWSVADSETGHWYTEIERAPAPDGPWTRVAGWPETQYVTTANVSVPSTATWYFRARARDAAGNWEAWPATAETSTTAYVDRSVHLTVSSYLDANSNGIQDPGEVGDPATVLTWQGADGMVATTTGAAWDITQTVDEGTYTIAARLPQVRPDYIASQRIVVPPGPGLVEFNVTLRLVPVRARIYMPIIAQQR